MLSTAVFSFLQGPSVEDMLLSEMLSPVATAAESFEVRLFWPLYHWSTQAAEGTLLMNASFSRNIEEHM